MWLAKQAALSDRERQGAVTTGEVTISGGSPGAKADGELRGLELAAPEGVYWKPRAGQQMLLLHADDGSELAAGVLGQAAPADLAPGHYGLPPSARRMLRTTCRNSTGRRMKSVQWSRTQRTANSWVSSTMMMRQS